MSESFGDDVRDLLTARISEAPAALDWSEIERRALGPDRAAPSGGRRTAPVVWLAVAAAVALVIGGAVLMLRNDDSGSVVIDEGPNTTVNEQPESTVDEVTPSDEDSTGEDQEGSEQTPGTANEEPAVAPRPVTLASPLGAPANGETQRSIVGDITWTRVQGDITTVPADVALEFDGVYYTNSLNPGVANGAEPQTQWWTSTDGLTWAVWDEAPANPLTVIGDTLWAESSDFWPGSQPGLSYWDGAAFVPIEPPASGDLPGAGLAVRTTRWSVVAEFDSAIVMQRFENLGVPWENLLGIEPPLQAVLDESSPWAGGNFRVRACTDGFPCSDSAESQQWSINPVVVEGVPARIELYSAGELITSIVPPDDGLPIDERLNSVACCNSAGHQIGYFITDADGTNVRALDWPISAEYFSETHFAELGGQLFVLKASRGIPPELWATNDLDTWEQIALPPAIDQNSSVQLSSDGSTMTLTTKNNTLWFTTDGESWTDGVSWKDQEPALTDTLNAAQPTDFGWWSAQLFDPDPERPANESPSIVLSPDGETWQIVPIPAPAALDDLGLTWADAGQTSDNPWAWRASAHGDTIFVTLDSDGLEQARELWIGHVDTS